MHLLGLSVDDLLRDRNDLEDECRQLREFVDVHNSERLALRGEKERLEALLRQQDVKWEADLKQSQYLDMLEQFHIASAQCEKLRSEMEEAGLLAQDALELVKFPAPHSVTLSLVENMHQLLEALRSTDSDSDLIPERLVPGSEPALGRLNNAGFAEPPSTQIGRLPEAGKEGTGDGTLPERDPSKDGSGLLSHDLLSRLVSQGDYDLDEWAATRPVEAGKQQRIESVLRNLNGSASSSSDYEDDYTDNFSALPLKKALAFTLQDLGVHASAQVRCSHGKRDALDACILGIG